MISIRDLAKLAEVSAATVSRVLNNDPTISVTDETRERIITLAKEMNYTPKNRKHSAKNTATKMSVGLIIRHNTSTEQVDPYFKNLREGIEETAKKWRLKVDILFRVHDVNKEWERISEYGAIIVIGRMSLSFYDKITNLNPHIIVVDDPFCPKNICSICNDFYDKTTEILNYLVQNGHRNISYIGGYQAIIDENGQRTTSDLDSRLLSYQKFMKEHQLQQYIHYYLGQWTSQGGYQLIQDMLNQTMDIPTAIIVGSDPLAIGVYHALHSSGYRIPDDVSIISFDDIGLTKYLTPALSSVYMDTTEMGKVALNMAKSMLLGEFTIPIHVTCTSQLNIRESIKERK